MCAMSPAFEPGALAAAPSLAVRAWNLMDGQIEWAALDTLVALLGVDDPERLIVELVAIREFHAQQRGRGN